MISGDDQMEVNEPRVSITLLLVLLLLYCSCHSSTSKQGLLFLASFLYFLSFLSPSPRPFVLSEVSLIAGIPVSLDTPRPNPPWHLPTPSSSSA